MGDLFCYRGNGAGTKSAWNDGRNWVNGAGTPYAQARYPGSDALTYDDVILDAALEAGAESLAGYDGSALVSLNSFKISSAYDGTVGSEGAYLSIPVDNAGAQVVIDASGCSGSVYLKSPGVTKLLNLRVLSGVVYLDGILNNPQFIKGTVSVAATATIEGDLLTVSQVTSQNDTTVTIPDGVTISTTSPIQVLGGVTTCAADLGAIDVIVSNGRWIQTNDLQSGVVNNGILQWDSGDITNNVEVYGGLFDGSLSTAVRTIGGNIIVHEPGRVNLDNGADTIILTGVLRTYNGSLTLPRGKELTLL